ncbi:hypothetical protein [Streptomyces sp. NPDC056663]|uniref:hypothetical protein n=1 Tax=Streptomyces sp. NPDC056663 TaxID=3345899 RepID=UPI0036896D2D
MTTAPDDFAGRPAPTGITPSTALVHLPRRALGRITPNAMAPAFTAQTTDSDLFAASFTQALTFAEKARSVSLIRDRSAATGTGVDAMAVEKVDGQLRLWIIQAKWSRSPASRERARLGVFAALNARRAILESRTVDGWKAAVGEFASTWLNVPIVTEQWLEAVSTALLGDWVNVLDEHLLDEAGDLGLKQLKTESTTVHRQLRPLWRRKVRGARLLSLDHPVNGGSTLADMLAGKEAAVNAPSLWEPDNERAADVIGQLSPQEQAVAKAWALGGRSSWPEAAEAAGFTEAVGDSVRRKLRALGRRYEQRQANAAATRGLWLPGAAGREA